MSDEPDLTLLLNRWVDGDQDVETRIFSALYPTLRALAARQLRREGSRMTLQPTELAHEAYLKLLRLDRIRLRDRHHFLALAATAIRRLAVSRARRFLAHKRGGEALRVTFDEALVAIGERSMGVLDLNAALEELVTVHACGARVVELRYFGGLSLDEVAELMGRSRRSVCRDWNFARAWLYDRLSRGPATPAE